MYKHYNIYHPNFIIFLSICLIWVHWIFGVGIGTLIGILLFWMAGGIYAMIYKVYKKFSVQGEEEAMENTLEVLGLLQQKQQKQKAHGHGREMSPDPEAPEDTDIMDGIDGGAN